MQDTEMDPSSWVNPAFIRLNKEHAAVACNKSWPHTVSKALYGMVENGFW